MAGMKVLFIGGTGNISAECAALLHERGYEVLVLSRGQMAVPPEYRAIRADRKDLAAMRAALAGVRPDVVLNFLGYDVPELQIDYELFRGAVRQYVFISSTVVYARPPRQLPMTEAAPFGNPLWDYAEKKVACEQWLGERRKETGFPVTIVRPSHTYSKQWVPNAVFQRELHLCGAVGAGQTGVCARRWRESLDTDDRRGVRGWAGRAGGEGGGHR